jgi:hypothetical protein
MYIQVACTVPKSPPLDTGCVLLLEVRLQGGIQSSSSHSSLRLSIKSSISTHSLLSTPPPPLWLMARAYCRPYVVGGEFDLCWPDHKSRSSVPRQEERAKKMRITTRRIRRKVRRRVKVDIIGCLGLGWGGEANGKVGEGWFWVPGVLGGSLEIDSHSTVHFTSLPPFLLPSPSSHHQHLHPYHHPSSHHHRRHGDRECRTRLYGDREKSRSAYTPATRVCVAAEFPQLRRTPAC